MQLQMIFSSGESMAAMAIRNCCAVLFLVLIVGVHSTWNISMQEDMELQRQLKILNKPPIKIIRCIGEIQSTLSHMRRNPQWRPSQVRRSVLHRRGSRSTILCYELEFLQTDYGDIVDCVDINNQPSLDHPLLNNHKVQTRPSNFPKSFKYKNSEADEPALPLESSVGLKEGCPPGTVPIRRTRKADLIRAKAFSKVHSKKYASNFHQYFQGAPGIHMAMKRTRLTTTSKYYGAQAYLNLYNLPVLSSQYSSVSMSLENGPYNEINVIETRWSVNPLLFGDNLTRFYTSWSADNFHRTGCHNLNCPGFVQVSSTINLGLAFTDMSINGGLQYDMKVRVYKDEHWWLFFQVDNEVVGYWPHGLFKSLSRHATWLSWGGEVYSPPNTPSPPMGNGHLYELGVKNFGHVCYARALQVQEKLGGNFTDLGSRTSDFVDNPKCYNIGGNEDWGVGWGHAFHFGGPGGKCGN